MAKNTRKQKPIPVINYDIRSIEDYDTITSEPQMRKVIYEHLVDAVEYGILTGKSKVDLFKIQDTDNVLTLTNDKWINTLNKAIEFYSSIEEYEKCLDCQELLSRLIKK